MTGGDGGGTSGGRHLHTFTIVLIVLGCVFTAVVLGLCILTACTKTLCFAEDDDYPDTRGDTGISYTHWSSQKGKAEVTEVVTVVDRGYVVGQDYHPPRQ